ncbi:MAG: hypothetical protein IT557_11860, partial [Alphaproteobacteria bacterium]|nr:hypothetical protein [Alphaproteobacteria bacterium]
MSLTAAEQYMLELINRARLDPAAEAARYGIDLNAGLAPGTISTSAKQVLAGNDLLHNAAALHSTWMLDTDIFSHTGNGGSSAKQRMEAAGYAFTGSWAAGENISWRGVSGTINLDTSIAPQHRNLFLSAGHRANMLSTSYREIGIGQEQGFFTHSDGNTYSSSMITQNFARSGTSLFLTGVAYTDSNGDKFYSIGEGVAGIGFAIGASAVASESAGGYNLGTTATGLTSVVITDGAASSTVQVDFSIGNVKLDLVGGSTVASSSNLVLVSGAAVNGRLLGIADRSLTGNGAANVLEGNRGGNLIEGSDGNDTLRGMDGNDTLDGQSGSDTLEGGAGDDTYIIADGIDTILELPGEGASDTVMSALATYVLPAEVERLLFTGAGNAALTGNAAANDITGGAGDDTLDGADGDDTLNGGAGADTMAGGGGNDNYTVDDAGDVVVELAGQGTIDVVSTTLATYVLPSEVERLFFIGAGNAALTGNALANVIYGGAGNDTINGGAG